MKFNIFSYLSGFILFDLRCFFYSLFSRLYLSIFQFLLFQVKHILLMYLLLIEILFNYFNLISMGCGYYIIIVMIIKIDQYL